MTARRPRCLELFAGCGGAALGLGRAGFEHAGLVEWDRWACATLRAAGFEGVVEGDVRELGPIRAVVGPGPLDVLWSSFPCQAWSMAGARLGARDTRNGWPWTVAAVDALRPTWVLAENVVGLTRHRRGCPRAQRLLAVFEQPAPDDCPGCYFERVVLADLRARFAHVGWWALDAADYGVPQNRARVFVWAGPVPLVEPEPTHGPGRPLAWVSMGEALGLAAGLEAQASVCDLDRGLRGAPRPVSRPSPTVPGASQVYVGPPRPCKTGRWGDGHPELPVDGPAPTITTEAGHARPWTKAGIAYLANPEVEHERRRPLTVEECAVLQDFPADYPLRGGVGARYRQVGNAVPPKLAEVVGRALLAAWTP